MCFFRILGGTSFKGQNHSLLCSFHFYFRFVSFFEKLISSLLHTPLRPVGLLPCSLFIWAWETRVFPERVLSPLKFYFILEDIIIGLLPAPGLPCTAPAFPHTWEWRPAIKANASLSSQFQKVIPGTYILMLENDALSFFLFPKGQRLLIQGQVGDTGFNRCLFFSK